MKKKKKETLNENWVLKALNKLIKAHSMLHIPEFVVGCFFSGSYFAVIGGRY